jgi:hypothetical protein
MATEAPLIHDGAQCTAGVDMSSTASLAGFNSTGQFLLVKFTAARSLIPTALAADFPYGVLQNDPKSGAVCDVGIFGVSKVISGAAITAGVYLMSDTSGRVITATATGGTSPAQIVGQAIEAATAANQVITAKICMVPNLATQP